MSNSVEVVEHTQAPNGVELITVQLRYWRSIHAELMTHRVFSRNASSSRAIPVKKMISQVWNDPAMPIHWGQNQPGMQAQSQLTGLKLRIVKGCWKLAAKAAASIAWVMDKASCHKQVANRILEPFQYISVIVSSTEWDNWDALRNHPDAQPEIQALARSIYFARVTSIARQLKLDKMTVEGWHLPYITPMERVTFYDDPEYLAKLSTARCARVSYLTHDNQRPSRINDLLLFDRLVGSEPLHASPTEHQAYALYSAKTQSKNFRGYRQFRENVEFNIKHNRK